MKRTMFFALSLMVLLAAAPVWAQRGSGPRQNRSGIHSFGAGLALEPLSATEEQWLVAMREEEKLARDVYLYLYEQWGIPVFDNISASEQRHFDAVGMLIEGYGLADPVADATPGAFSNPEFSDLYLQLTAQGSASIAEAMKVGAAIEELDIRDLVDALAQAENADVLRVFGNLLKGSTNHLQTFVSFLQVLGETYTPQYLDAETFAGLLSATRSGRGPR